MIIEKKKKSFSCWENLALGVVWCHGCEAQHSLPLFCILPSFPLFSYFRITPSYINFGIEPNPARFHLLLQRRQLHIAETPHPSLFHSHPTPKQLIRALAHETSSTNHGFKKNNLSLDIVGSSPSRLGRVDPDLTFLLFSIKTWELLSQGKETLGLQWWYLSLHVKQGAKQGSHGTKFRHFKLYQNESNLSRLIGPSGYCSGLEPPSYNSCPCQVSALWCPPWTLPSYPLIEKFCSYH